MTEFVVSFMHIDEVEEERCIDRFIWDLPDKNTAWEQARRLIPQVAMESEECYDAEFEKNNIHVSVTDLDNFLLLLRRRGIGRQQLYEDVKKYDFVKEGATVIWNDPDDGACSGPKVVKECSFYYDEDSTVLLVNEDGTGETEAYYSELDPYKETH